MKKFLSKLSLLSLIATLGIFTACDAMNIHSGGKATCTKGAICQYCGEEYGEPLGHTWAEATCTTPKTCTVKGCGATEGEALGHIWAEATCTEPKTCTVKGCGATEGEALGHVWADATCTEPKTCTVEGCGATEGAANGHVWNQATCTDPKTCTVEGCGATEGEANGHDWADATCTTPKTCKTEGCGVTEGEALGHDWADATCTTPKTCKAEGCGVTEGEALGHDWADATCTAPKTCKTEGCGATEGEALGHDWADATCTAPKTCKTEGCGATEGEALGHTFIDSKCHCGADYEAPEATGAWTLVTELHDGDRVLIGAPAYGKLLSAEKVTPTSYYNKGVDYTIENFDAVTNAEIFAVKVNADGTYTFTSLTGDVIALAASFSSLNKDGEHKSWKLEDKGNGLFLVKNTGRNTYLEWYNSKGNWSTYTAGNTDEYKLSFYARQQSAENHVHNHISEVHENTCTEDGYTKYTCACGNTYTVEGEKATGHNHTITTVTEPTCTEDGYTTHACECGDSYTDTIVPATGHTFVNGECACGEKEQTGPVVTTGSADFNSIVLPSGKPNGDSSYTATYTTANGWVSKNSAIQCGGSQDMNPQFVVVGPNNTYKAVCLNGKTSAVGSLTSPTLNGGLSKLTINYTKMFTDTKLSVTITVTEISSGKTYTHDITVEKPKNEKYVVYTDEWDLEAPVVGDFTIEIKNNCPSAVNGNKDRITILSVDWVGALPVHTHEYTSTTTATCTTAGITTYTCECGDTYTEEVEKLGHVDANLDIDCDREGCTSKVAPAANSVLSIFTANNLGSKLSTSFSYYVEGTIVEVLDASSGIFLIGNDTEAGTFYFRLPKNAEGISHASWTVKLTLGDKVSVYGKINKYSTSSAPNGQYYPSIQGGVVTILEQHAHDYTAIPATCMEPAYCHCGQNNGIVLGHTDTDANNVCDICAWGTNVKLEKLITYYDHIKGTENVTTENYTWKGTEFNFVVNKATGTLNTSASNHVRVQKNNSLTISATNGKKILSITFVASSASYVDELQAFLTAAGYEHTTNGLEVTISVDSLESITLNNASTKTARIANVKIVYA